MEAATADSCSTAAGVLVFIHALGVAAACLRMNPLATTPALYPAGGKDIISRNRVKVSVNSAADSGMSRFRVALIMISLAAVHLCAASCGGSGVSPMTAHRCRGEDDRYVTPVSVSPLWWLGPSLLMINLAVYLTFKSFILPGGDNPPSIIIEELCPATKGTDVAIRSAVRFDDCDCQRQPRPPGDATDPLAMAASAVNSHKAGGSTRAGAGQQQLPDALRRYSFSWQESCRLHDLANLTHTIGDDAAHHVSALGLSSSDEADLPTASDEIPSQPAAEGEPTADVVEVLHVDDDPVQHAILAQWLKRYTDTTVTKVSSGEVALELLEDRASRPGSVQRNFPTVIVMDQLMPGMSGTKAARRIRELYPQAIMPIIIMSSLAADQIRSTGDYLASGVNDVVTKPLSRLSLVTTVACQLGNSNLQRKNLLLRSILPDSIIARLTAGQNVIADRHESVSILFSDIVGYTSLSARTNTPDLIQILNSLFTAFDRLTDKHGVYKVETIGDAYMAAAGHSAESAKDHSQRLIRMAKDMLKASESIELPDGTSLKIRVGVHTGPAYAGVVGEKCPRYCFFGDTVNTASRMESTSFPQCIQVSKATFSHFRASAGGGSGDNSPMDGFYPLGSRAVKGKGEMETFLVADGDWEAVPRAVSAVLAASSLGPRTPDASVASSCNSSVDGVY